MENLIILETAKGLIIGEEVQLPVQDKNLIILDNVLNYDYYEGIGEAEDSVKFSTYIGGTEGYVSFNRSHILSYSYPGEELSAYYEMLTSEDMQIEVELEDDFITLGKEDDE